MRSLRFSTILQLAFTAIAAVLYLAGCLILLGIQSRQNRTELNYLLYSEVEALASYLAAGGGLDFPELVRMDEEHTPGPIWLRVLREGEVVAATPDFPGLPDDFASEDFTESLTEEDLTEEEGGGRSGKAQADNLRTIRAADGDKLVWLEHPVWNQPNTRVQAFMRPRLIDRRLRSMLDSLLLTGLILLPISLLASRYLTRTILQPVQRLMSRIDSISPDDLSQRVPEPWRVVEIAALAGAFNRLLSRVEAAVHRMQRFTANASHELRSPLASLRTSLQVCLRRSRSEAEYRELGEEMLLEIERLSRSVEALLLLARQDRGEQPAPSDTVDLRAIAGSARRTLAALIEERGLELRIEVSTHAEMSSRSGADTLPPVLGDAAQLELMLINLLDNAVKHSPQGGEVRIELDVEPPWVRLRVRDQGPGIPEADRAFIFERHYQGRAATRPSSSRVGGIGLDLVRWVVRLQGGEVHLRDQPRGACFEVLLPVASSAEHG